ncbi:hypothetical protein DFR70_103191 [Nocardia tenerifensis]|uniref:Uncharacterized protein n=1 Tax=Nocardia tenerifensis TaxID=228006 RepID=A0A318KH50_9NOCA|nr:hypothetical protein [Nocardia tenerifensis]PXX66443.1 hypothetical protein DFR70_103191 [Nocardia tenerifensis]
MGGFRPYTKAELEQIERDQQDPKWLEWLAPENMNAQLDAFLNETVPDMSDNPWSAGGLDQAERYILDHFHDMDEVDRPQNATVADQLSRFIGEVFRRNFEGAWFNVPSMGGDRYKDFGPVIRHEWTDVYLDTGNLITATVDRQWGDYLSGIFSNSLETYREWVTAGRPPMAEWLKD